MVVPRAMGEAKALWASRTLHSACSCQGYPSFKARQVGSGGGFPGSCLLAFWSSRAEDLWPMGASLWKLAPLHPD